MTDFLALMLWIVGAIVALLLFAQLNRWIKTWLFRPPQSRHPFHL